MSIKLGIGSVLVNVQKVTLLAQRNRDLLSKLTLRVQIKASVHSDDINEWQLTGTT